MTHLPLHAGHAPGLSPVPLFVGALVGIAIWLGIRWLATGGDGPGRRGPGRRGA